MNKEYYLIQYNEIPDRCRMFLVPVEEVDDTVLEMLEFMDGQVVNGGLDLKDEQTQLYIALLEDLFSLNNSSYSGKFNKHNGRFANKGKITEINFFVKRAFSLAWIL
jgi:hypothetical protein